jgi:hypothetical protein
MRLASIEAGHRQALHDSELDASNEEGGGGGLCPQTKTAPGFRRLWRCPGAYYWQCGTLLAVSTLIC